MKMLLWYVGVVSVLVTGFSTLSTNVEGFEYSSESLFDVQSQNMSLPGAPLMINQTFITSAVSKGAVCLDGSPPVYHFHPGFGSGKNSWIVDLEGGGWCNNPRSCIYRKTSRHGSSKFMEKQIAFVGLLSNKAEENPDFYNWNRVRVRYCDGASFSGEGENLARGLQFRGLRIWSAAMEELMSKGMRDADQALLSGCSAGGLATIRHCDDFRKLFPATIKVKCLSDGGLFLDEVDVSGGNSIRYLFNGVVQLQDVKAPSTCQLDPTSCFFPQNLINNVTTPLFILNSAYDAWQLLESIAPGKADPKGEWTDCKKNHLKCSASQIEVLQGFRNQMVKIVNEFSSSKKNGVFLNSCFSHCQTIDSNTWLAKDSPVIGKKAIATAVGDWYFDRAARDRIDCPYPCDKTCHHLI